MIASNMTSAQQLRVPHPIPYQGSKRRIASLILSHFPEGVDTLIEPFAGSAAISIAGLASGRVKRAILNDVNKPLMNLWRVIIENPKQLSEQYRRLWNEQSGKERAFYDSVRDRFNKTQNSDLFLYLLARCVKASVRYNAQGKFNQSPDNRRRGAHPDTMAAHIFGASALLRGRVALYSEGYEEIALKATREDLVYMDPPYQGVSGKRDGRYIRGVGITEFILLLQRLNKQGISFIVSYDGQCGSKTYGQLLPATLNLTRIKVPAGRSSQETLLGRKAVTTESLYLSQPLLARIKSEQIGVKPLTTQEEFVFAK